MAVILPPASQLLEVISTKQLPQSKQIPTMYTTEFEHSTYIDLALVILALRKDVASVYDQLGNVNSNLQLQINAINVRLDNIDLVLTNHEGRIAALETP